MTKIELIRAAELGQSELDLWDTWRAAQTDLHSPYFTHKWMKHVARVRGDVDVAVLLDEQSQISAFLPMQHSSARVAVPVGGALSDYHGLIARPGFTGDLQHAMQQAKIGRFDFFNIPASQDNFAAFAHVDHVSHVIDVTDGLEAYLQSRRDKGSSETKRARKRKRKLEREMGPVRLEMYSSDTYAFAQLLSWKQQQYRHTNTPNVFATRWPLELVQNLFFNGGKDKFGGALFLLYASDQLVAANYCLADQGVLHAWFIAHDPDVSRYSPGQILFESMIEELADTDITEIDLGAGAYRFKTSLANVTRPLHGGFVAGNSLCGLLRDTQYGLRQLVEKLPLGSVSELPGKAMRRMDVYRGLT